MELTIEEPVSKLSKSDQEKLNKWKKECSYNKIIPRTNLIVCKVFLMDDKWKDDLTPESAWDLLTLVESLKKDNKKISLILDLNRSLDYYNFEEFVQKNPEYNEIRYKKIPLEDKVVPPPEMIQEAHDLLDEYYDKEGVIVVHCFNGRNRSGYIVGSYLCKKFSITGEEAISIFVESRGLQIEYEAIKEHLKAVYQLV